MQLVRVVYGCVSGEDQLARTTADLAGAHRGRRAFVVDQAIRDESRVARVAAAVAVCDCGEVWTILAAAVSAVVDLWSLESLGEAARLAAGAQTEFSGAVSDAKAVVAPHGLA